MDFKDYIEALENLLWLKYMQGVLTDRKGTKIKEEEQAQMYIASELRAANLRGSPDPEAPFYKEVMSYVAPLWQAEALEKAKEEIASLQEEDWARKFAESKESRRQWEWSQGFDWQKRREEEQAFAAERRWGAEEARRGTEAQNRLWEEQWKGWERGTKDLSRMWTEQAVPNTLNEKYHGQPTPAQQAQQFERLRQQILSSLEGDKDANWINIANVKGKPNPYKNAAGPDRLAELKEHEKYYEDMLKEVDKRTADPSDPAYKGDWYIEAQKNMARQGLNQIRGMITSYSARQAGIPELSEATGMSPSAALETAKRYGANIFTPGQTRLEEWANLTPEQEGALAEGARSLGYGGYGSGWGKAAKLMAEASYPRTEVPKWLPQFVPGLTGKYLPQYSASYWQPAQEKIPQAGVPKYEAWQNLLPSQQKQWSAYATYAKQSPEDLLAQMSINERSRLKGLEEAKKSFPRNLSLGKTWKPARQRI